MQQQDQIRQLQNANKQYDHIYVLNADIKITNINLQESMHHPATTNMDTDFQIPKIVNVVGTFTLDINDNLKLKQIASKWNGSRYNKQRFRGLVARNTDPRVTYMIFSNGKVIVTGAQSEYQCELSCTKLIKKMSKFGVLKSIKPKVVFKPNNIVATVFTKYPVDLQGMSHRFRSQPGCHFEPQCFPGLIYRMKNPKATFLVFSNGKIVMTGVQSEAKVAVCFRQFYHNALKKFRKIPNRTNRN